MRAFISDHTFEVHHVAHYRVFACNAHAAQHLAGITTNVGCYFAGVSLAMLTCCGVTFPSFINTPRRQFNNCALVISVTISASFLLQLKTTNGFSKLNSFLTVI